MKEKSSRAMHSLTPISDDELSFFAVDKVFLYL
jgi:hypothetical protein